VSDHWASVPWLLLLLLLLLMPPSVMNSAARVDSLPD